MILTLTASIMYWSLQRPSEDSEPAAEETTSQKSPSDGEDGSSIADGVSNLTVDDTASETSQAEILENGNSPNGE